MTDTREPWALSPSRESIQELECELDTFLTPREKEYFDDIVRLKQYVFTKEISTRRKQYRAAKGKSTSMTQLHAKDQGKRKSVGMAVAVEHLKSSQSLTPLDESSSRSLSLESTAPIQHGPLHSASLRLEHMLEREIHATKHRKAMELFAVKLETEVASWKQKYKEEVARSMQTCALEEEIDQLKASNHSLTQELCDIKRVLERSKLEIQELQKELNTTQKHTQAIAIDVLDQTKLTTNEFEVRLLQEQFTSAELREMLANCTKSLEELTKKQVAIVVPKQTTAELQGSLQRRQSIQGNRRREKMKKEPCTRARCTSDYMLTTPWYIYADYFQVFEGESIPNEYQERLWQQRSEASIHRRWMDNVVQHCGLSDETLHLWDVVAVLETTNSLWIEKRLDDIYHMGIYQSLPKFARSWFIQRYKSHLDGMAQFYLYTIGLVEHRSTHPRLDLMATMLGLTNVKCYLPRLADCIFRAMTHLIPFPSLASTLATTMTKQTLNFDQLTVEATLADVFPRKSNGIMHTIDQCYLSSESHERMIEILSTEILKAGHLTRVNSTSNFNENEDIINTSRSVLNTTRTMNTTRTTTSSTLLQTSRRQHTSFRAKKPKLSFEAVLRIVLYIWMHQMAQDLEECIDFIQDEDSSEGLTYDEFRTKIIKHYENEFNERELIKIYEMAANEQQNNIPISHVQIYYLAKCILAKGYSISLVN